MEQQVGKDIVKRHVNLILTVPVSPNRAKKILLGIFTGFTWRFRDYSSP